MKRKTSCFEDRAKTHPPAGAIDRKYPCNFIEMHLDFVAVFILSLGVVGCSNVVNKRKRGRYYGKRDDVSRPRL